MLHLLSRSPATSPVQCSLPVTLSSFPVSTPSAFTSHLWRRATAHARKPDDNWVVSLTLHLETGSLCLFSIVETWRSWSTRLQGFPVSNSDPAVEALGLQRHYHTCFFVSLGGFKLKSSCLYDKYLTHFLHNDPMVFTRAAWYRNRATFPATTPLEKTFLPPL